jgi:NAD(P)-dependent dehydrogenase (short-subunit alcohol dehydrogenase family)
MSKILQPEQKQSRQPGHEHEMDPPPDYEPVYPGSGRLKDKRVIITGGDSGIGRAVAVAMAREGADIAFFYLDEAEDAQETERLVQAEGRKVFSLAGNIGEARFCREAVAAACEALGGVDVLVNNAAEQHEVDGIEDLLPEQLEQTFRTNVFGYFHMAREVIPRFGKAGGSIVNTTSITAYKGHPTLLDYAATRGAVVAFTRSLAKRYTSEGIRVNAVAPGPIWTPLIPASFEPERVAAHGASAPMGRPGQPREVAPCYVFLASEDAAYMSGQVLHPNGGTIVGS